MNCPTCAVVVICVCVAGMDVVSIGIRVTSCSKHTHHRSFILWASMPLVLACQNFGHFDLYFSNGRHFYYLLYVSLLPKLKTLILDSCHLYPGYTYRKHKGTFFKIFTFCTFSIRVPWDTCHNGLVVLSEVYVGFICQSCQMSRGPPQAYLFATYLILSRFIYILWLYCIEFYSDLICFDPVYLINQSHLNNMPNPYFPKL